MTTTNPDATSDGSIVRPNDRKRVELGTITLAALARNTRFILPIGAALGGACYP